MEIKKELRKLINIFLFSLIIIIFIGIALVISYYFLIYLEPNFDSENVNYIKSAGAGEVSPDSEITLELSYGNTGYREVSDFTAEFFIPQHTTLKNTSQPGKYYNGKNSVIFESKILKKDEGQKILITLLTDKPLDNGIAIKFKDVETKYTVSGNFMPGSIKNGVTYKIKSSPDISLSEMVLKDKNGGTISMGDEVSFSFNSENNGDMNATGVEITAAVPAGTSLVKNSVFPEGYEVKEGSIIWNLGGMQINNPVDFSYSVKVLTGFTDFEKITGSVNLKSSQGADLSSQAEGEIRLFPDLGNSEISLEDKNGEFLWAGDRIIVKALLVNDGERSAEGVIFTCPIPESSAYVKDSASCKDADISFENNELVFKIAEIKTGEGREAVFEIQTSPKMTSGGTIGTGFNLSANGTEFAFPVAEINVKANYRVTIACLGDSLIARSDWPQVLDNLLESTYIHTDFNTIASGIGGELSSGGYNRFDSSIANYHPEIVIVGYGTNDIGSGTDRFSYYLGGIVQKAKALNATVFLESLGYINTSMEPSKADWPKYQKVIYQVGGSYGVPVVDVYTALSQNPRLYVADWVHYTPEGSSLVAHILYNYVIQYLDSEGRRK